MTVKQRVIQLSVSSGDVLQPDDTIAMIETDKVTIDVKYTGSVPAVLTMVNLKADDSVTVGQAVATVDDDPAAVEAAGGSAPAKAVPAETAVAPPKESAASARTPPPVQKAAPAPAPVRFPESHSGRVRNRAPSRDCPSRCLRQVPEVQGSTRIW